MSRLRTEVWGAMVMLALIVGPALAQEGRGGREREERPRPSPVSRQERRGEPRDVEPGPHEFPEIVIPAPPDGEGPGGGDDEPVLTPRQTEEVLEVLREYDPELAQRLEAWRQRSPERVGEVLRPQLSNLWQLVYLRRNNPEMFRLRVQDYRLSRATTELGRALREAREANDEERARQLRAELEDRVRQHFKLRQEIREFELAQLEKRIEELRQQIEKRRGQGEQLIQERVRELIGESDRPEW